MEGGEEGGRGGGGGGSTRFSIFRKPFSRLQKRRTRSVSKQNPFSTPFSSLSHVKFRTTAAAAPPPPTRPTETEKGTKRRKREREQLFLSSPSEIASSSRWKSFFLHDSEKRCVTHPVECHPPPLGFVVVVVVVVGRENISFVPLFHSTNPLSGIRMQLSPLHEVVGLRKRKRRSFSFAPKATTEGGGGGGGSLS